jgi:nucleoside-diphosphate-sugar epimerase
VKILVTGGSGFIGSHLVDRMLEKGYDVRCLVRKTSNLRWLKDPKIELVTGSFFDESALKKAVIEVDYVYHVAGAVMSKTKSGYFVSNHLATKNLIESCLKFNRDLKRFIFVSSSTVCGPSYDGKPVNETTPCFPITNYGRSKLEAEKEVLSNGNEIPVTVIRAPAIYGPRDEAIYYYFKAVNSGLISLIGFSNKYVSLIHSSDLVKGIILAGENEKAISQIYFISSDGWYSWVELSEVIRNVVGRKTITIRIPHFLVYTTAAISQLIGYFSAKGAVFNIEKAKDFTQQYWICDISKAKNELGYYQEINLEDGIRDTIEWYKKNGWLK